VKTINLDGWPRKDHYLFFREFEYPYFSLCANMDITNFLPLIKAKEISFTAAIMYLVGRVANGIPEFRQRIRDEGPIEHEVVHPSATILGKDDLFTFCTAIYQENFLAFAAETQQEILRIKTEPSLEEKIEDDSMLFMTSIPWVSFTGFMHPVKLSPADSVPRFAWGKFREEGQKTVMPLSVQGHHALMDGLHAGLFYEEFQRLLDNPKQFVGNK
jgi:chloramphenicol O-acetyltransferase type A